MWPDGRIALRSLMEMPITFEGCPDILSSSPTVLTSRRRGEDPFVPGVPPRSAVDLSLTLLTASSDSRSSHSLLIMPLMEGVAPLRNVECPTAVTQRQWRL